jgi:hypothetical protein
MFLKHADVHISEINSRAFRITTSQDSYKLARSILLNLKDQCALPLHLHSEEVAAVTKKAKVVDKSIVFTHHPDIIFEENLPPRYRNEFIVEGHRLVGQDRNKMIILANNLADNLKSFGLSVVIHA